MTHKSLAIVLLLSAGFLSSCVSSKKYKSKVAEAEQLTGQNNQLKTKNDELTTQVASMKQQTDENAAKQDAAMKEFAKYKQECDAAQEKLKAAQGALEEQYNTLHGVMEKLEAAMADFHDKGVDVYEKDGLVYVSMSDNLLYKSGSAALGANGKEALGTLANVLNDYPKLKVIVVGNTDNTKFKGGGDNLSLSTERANGVVRVLCAQYKVDPTRVTAAGKGMYAPVADNASKEGRAKNRRTDIILNPDLARIWETVKEEQAQKK